MTKKDKEEERIEKIIRGLLKLPENRRCINCNSLGPQYVCTTFFTFVCTSCSGIHREFTHRVKSVSMAKFNAEEVSALQAEGNERARQIYLKDWDPQRNQLPDGSNLQKLRDFIKHVYVDRRYTGEKSEEKLSRLRLTDKEESSENRRVVLYSGGSRTLNYEDRQGRSERCGFSGRTDDKTFRYYDDERRSPRYSQENTRYGGFKKSPARFEVVDDRFRDDKIRSVRQTNVHLFSPTESRFGNRSSDIQKNNAPVVRPLKDILGENLPPLQVVEHSKAPNGKDASVHSQTPASSCPMASADGNPVQQKSHNSESSVDLNADSKSSNATAAPVALENLPSSEEGNCSYESSGKENIPPVPKPNMLEFLLMELSVPSVIPFDNTSEIPTNDNPSSATSEENILMSSGSSVAGPSGQMFALPSSGVDSATDASTTASGDNMPAGSVSLPVEQMLTLPSSAGASTAVSRGTMTVGSVSLAAPVVQTATASGISLPEGDPVPVVPLEETLTLIDAFDAYIAPLNTSLPVQPSNAVPPQAALDNNGDSTFKVFDGQQISTMQQQSSALLANKSSTEHQTTNTPAGGVNDQIWTSSNVPNAQGPPDFLGEYPSQDVSTPAQESNSDAKSMPLASETKSGGRKELPVDLFTTTIPTPGPIPGWQISPPYGMGFNMQYYPNATPVPAYPNTTKSTNPFNLNGESTSVQAPPFPSMGNLHSGLPMHTSALPPQSPPFASAMPYGGYMGQQAYMNLPNSRPQGPGDLGSEGFPFGSLDMAQQSTNEYLLPTSSSSLPSRGGNPFG
ncbi:probable ADP-ribosylation factor GTPase-activating protein AGD14 [Populus nigra]|uniref:probable ADP-ribosylation factor GTPase-activating protein AGD14 n=1 Tax=Populus nigra TaxID=3691 RepID=UPI002B27043D|nr:probable ADP-ribosylation factor GTPase-activating protein AGD14 [Populus nigra]